MTNTVHRCYPSFSTHVLGGIYVNIKHVVDHKTVKTFDVSLDCIN